MIGAFLTFIPLEI